MSFIRTALAYDHEVELARIKALLDNVGDIATTKRAQGRTLFDFIWDLLYDRRDSQSARPKDA